VSDRLCPDCGHRMDMHRKLDGCLVMVKDGARVPRCKCERKPEAKPETPA
jgi:hypothetical protein